MATSISTIYDNFLTLLSGQLTTYKKLPNPYILNSNNQLYLAKGFGVSIGPGNRIDLHTGCRISYERIFNLVLTNQVVTTDHNTSARESLEKGLIEDFIKLRIALENDPTLTGSCIKMDYSSDSGILFGETEEELKYMTINIDCLCLYEETLT